jgi:transcriptional regulator of heat shock response
MIVEKMEDENKNQFFVFLIGPKRMNYIKSINYFKKLCQKN